MSSNKSINRRNIPKKKIIPLPPKKIESIPPPAIITKKPEGNSFFNTLKEGFSFGVGSSIGHRMVDGIFNNNKDMETNVNKNIETNINKNSDNLYQKYNECMNNNTKENFDINECIKILESN
jgi:hypothetical protein